MTSKKPAFRTTLNTWIALASVITAGLLYYASSGWGIAYTVILIIVAIALVLDDHVGGPKRKISSPSASAGVILVLIVVFILLGFSLFQLALQNTNLGALNLR